MNLGTRNLLLHVTRLCPEAVHNMLCNLSLKAECQIYNSLDMDEDRKTPDQKFTVVELQNPPTDYHTWGCPLLFLESPYREDQLVYLNGNQGK